MAKKYLVIEEYHVTMRVPDDLSNEAADAVREILESKLFIAQLRDVVAAVVARHTSLILVKVGVSR